MDPYFAVGLWCWKSVGLCEEISKLKPNYFFCTWMNTSYFKHNLIFGIPFFGAYYKSFWCGEMQTWKLCYAAIFWKNQWYYSVVPNVNLWIWLRMNYDIAWVGNIIFERTKSIFIGHYFISYLSTSKPEYSLVIYFLISFFEMVSTIIISKLLSIHYTKFLKFLKTKNILFWESENQIFSCCQFLIQVEKLSVSFLRT